LSSYLSPNIILIEKLKAVDFVDSLKDSCNNYLFLFFKKLY
jgi:hypothetical protein